MAPRRSQRNYITLSGWTLRLGVPLHKAALRRASGGGVADLMKDPHQQLIVVLNFSEAYSCVGAAPSSCAEDRISSLSLVLDAAVQGAGLAGCIAYQGDAP